MPDGVPDKVFGVPCVKAAMIFVVILLIGIVANVAFVLTAPIFIDDKYVPIVASQISCFGTMIGSVLTCGTALCVAWWVNGTLKKHETVFGHLHKKKAEAIESLFKKLVLVKETLGGLANITEASPGDQNKYFLEARMACNDFMCAFHDNRIYLDKSFCQRIQADSKPTDSKHVDSSAIEPARPDEWAFENAMQAFLASVDGYIAAVQFRQDEASKPDQDAINKLTMDFQREITPSIEALETEFRKMLGNE